MKKYSRLRWVLAVVFVVFGFNVMGMGSAIQAFNRNQRMAPYVQRGLGEKIAELEKQYSEKGLKEGVSQVDFETKLGKIKKYLSELGKGSAFGIWGSWSEKIVILLSIIVSALFFVNALLIIKHSAIFDLSMSFLLSGVIAFVIALCGYFLVEMFFVSQTISEVTKLTSMLQAGVNVEEFDRRLFLMRVICSPYVILPPVFILLLFLGVPSGLYVWLKKREKNNNQDAQKAGLE